MPTGEPHESADEAVERLFGRHAERIFRLGLYVCDSPEGAADLVQETFLRALGAWEGFEGRSDEMTWLYTIATRACQRMQRRRAGEPRRFESISEHIPGGLGPLANPVGDPFDNTAREETARRVRAALSELSPDFRLPLLLKDLEGLAVAQVAEILGLKEATVKTRLRRARLKLAEKVSDARARGREIGHEGSCLDLLEARLSAEDRGVPFPLPDETLCERCRSTFEALDLVATACAALHQTGVHPAFLAQVRRRVRATRSSPPS